MKNGRYILATALLIAVLGAQLASAAGGYEARARKPAYDSDPPRTDRRRRLRAAKRATRS